MAKDLVFELGPTQRRFVYSQAHIAHLIGPMGEGKTHAGVAAMIWHAKRSLDNAAKSGINMDRYNIVHGKQQFKGIQAAIVRDTHQNIKTSTVKSIAQVLGSYAVFKDDSKKLYIRSNPAVEVDLFGIDDEASLSKLQGPEYALIWLEEPAPIIEKINAGLPKAVFDMALARAARQIGAMPRVQITQNPSEDDHWTSALMEDPEDYMVVEVEGVLVTITKQTFHIPSGENKHLNALSRAMQMAAFKDDPGKWARYIEGKTATVLRGKVVTPGYAAHIHFSQKILPIYPQAGNPNLAGFRGWDGYQHPCCITAQFNPLGQFVIHDVLYDEGVGTEELIEEKLLPLLASAKYKGKIKNWRDIGDPSMATADQSSTKRSAAKVIRDTLKSRFEPGPTRWSNRIEPVNHGLKRMLNEGRPAIILSASATKLHRALRGGWHYKKDNSGHIVGTLPIKDEHSHPGDAFASLISVIMPHDVQKEIKKTEKDARMKRALSYGSDTSYRRQDSRTGASFARI